MTDATPALGQVRENSRACCHTYRDCFTLIVLCQLLTFPISNKLAFTCKPLTTHQASEGVAEENCPPLCPQMLSARPPPSRLWRHGNSLPTSQLARLNVIQENLGDVTSLSALLKNQTIKVYSKLLLKCNFCLN